MIDKYKKLMYTAIMSVLKKLKIIRTKIGSLPTGHLFGAQTIPTTKDEKWQYVIQNHNADRAGQHYDVRLASPTINRGYSWAGRYLPKDVGETRLFIRQPDHNVSYFDFSGTLHGYGAGTVALDTRGEAYVHNSSPNRISFSYADKKYTLVDVGSNKWLFIRTK
jgi:hypothetical protein